MASEQGNKGQWLHAEAVVPISLSCHRLTVIRWWLGLFTVEVSNIHSFLLWQINKTCRLLHQRCRASFITVYTFTWAHHAIMY